MCNLCLSMIPRISAPERCEICSAPATRSLSRCERCRRIDYSFDAHTAVCEYRNAGSSLIRAYKFNGRRSLRRLIAQLMAQELPASWRGGEIVPVPPRRRSLRRRGYDAVGELAHHIGCVSGMPVERRLRSVGRHEQKALSYEGRLKNVSGRFALIGRSSISAVPVVLVDDVFTTGATLSECARLLKTAGAREVFCLSFAMEL
ncbi:MAG: ComF family protein [Spirochaetaceae bacterium]|nr:ComF family protein [Spirochaetaceae bacterium]